MERKKNYQKLTNLIFFLIELFFTHFFSKKRNLKWHQNIYIL